MDTPRTALRYMSYELAEALGVLSDAQQRLIFRAVLHDRYTGKTLIPWKFIGTGPGKLVAERTYCGHGETDADGNVHGAGWLHQPAFVEAVRLAKARVLEVDLEDDLRLVAKAREGARRKLAAVVRRWDDIMDDEKVPARDRIAAGSCLVEFGVGGLAQGEGAAAGSEEADWWKAANEER